MYRWERANFTLVVNGHEVWSGRQPITAWLAKEHGGSEEFFQFTSEGETFSTFDPTRDFPVTTEWIGAIGPYGQYGEGDDERPPVDIPIDAHLIVNGENVGEITLRGYGWGLADSDYLMFDGRGSAPSRIAPDPGPARAPRNAQVILDAIEHVRRLTHQVEDTCDTEAERACARSVREGLAVLEEFARGKADESIARAAFQTLKTSAERLSSLSRYPRLVMLGVQLFQMLAKIDLP